MSASHLRGLRGQLDPVLTNLALGYKQADFIAEKIFPVVFTEKEGVRVPVFGKGSFVEYQTERAVGAASNVITLDSPSFMPVVLEEHDLAAVWITVNKPNQCTTSAPRQHAVRSRACSCVRKSKLPPSCKTNRLISPVSAKTWPPPKNGAIKTLIRWQTSNPPARLCAQAAAYARRCWW